MYFLPPESVQPGDTVASLKERVFTIMYAFAREHSVLNGE
jgi:hypothetical protein